MRYRDATNSAHWWGLKDKVKMRCHSICEYCDIRIGDQLHHRHYETVGWEREQDVMLLCRLCHAAIEGKLKDDQLEFKVRIGSLNNLGDSGRDTNDLWKEYLATGHSNPDRLNAYHQILENESQERRRKERDRMIESWERCFGRDRSAWPNFLK